MRLTKYIFCVFLFLNFLDARANGSFENNSLFDRFTGIKRYAVVEVEEENYVLDDINADTLSTGDKIAKVLRDSQKYIGLAKEASDKVKQLGNYKDKISKEYELPFAITKTVGAKEYEIIIDSLVITPRYAYAVAYCIIVNPEEGDTLYFGATDVRFTRNGGFTGDAKLFLMRNYQVEFDDAAVLDFFATEERMSYVTFDCQGFKNLHLELDIWFSPEHILKVVNGEPSIDDTLMTSLSLDMQGFEDIYLEITGLPSFQFKKLPNFEFQFTTLVLDYSTYQHKANSSAFIDYEHQFFTSSADDSIFWKGIILEELTVTLPQSFKRQKEYTQNDYEPIKFGVRDMLIDDLGFTAQIFAQNLIQKNKGDIEGWAYTLDEFSTKIKYSVLESFTLEGTIGTPVTDETDAFSYTGSLNVITADITLTVSITDQVQFPLWKAGDVVLKSNSSITLNYNRNDKKFTPSACLNGVLSLSVGVGNKNEINSGSQEGKNIKLPSITFDNLTVQTTSPRISGGTFGFGNAGFMAGMPITIKGIEVVNDQQNVDLSGLKVHVFVNLMGEESNGFAAEGVFRIWGKKLDNSKLIKYEIDHVKIDSLALDIQNNVFGLKGSLCFFKNDIEYGSGFNAAIELKLKKVEIEVQAKALFGKHGDFAADGTMINIYRYWYVDANVAFPKAIPVIPGVFLINSFGGGLYHGMKMTTEPTQSQYGMTSSGVVYKPNRDMGLGLKAMIGFQGESKKIYSGQLTLEFLFRQQNNSGLEDISFYGYVGFMNTKVSEELTVDVEKVGADLVSNENPKKKDANDIEVEEVVTDAIGRKLSEYKFGAKWFMNCNFTSDDKVTFKADFGVYINAPNVKGVVDKYNKAGNIEMLFSDEQWYIYAGTPKVPVKVNLKGLPIEVLSVYFVIGSVLPEFQDLSEIGIVVDESKLDASVGIKGAKASGGFAVGSRMEFKAIDKTFLFFYCKMNSQLGFDIMMGDFSNYLCSGASDSPGINGWYASGRIYASVSADMGLSTKLFGKVTRVSLGNISSTAVLSAKVPNPSYFAGMLAFDYNVLAGLIKGDGVFYFDFGETCVLVGDPLEGVDIISDLSPSSGNEISVFSYPEAAFNMPIEKPFNLFDPASGDSLKYIIKLNKFQLTTVNGSNVDFKTSIWNGDNTILKKVPISVLPSEQTMQFLVEVEYKLLIGDKWESKGFETLTKTFKTGQEPGNIVDGNIDYSYPLPEMDNYYIDQYQSTAYVRLNQNQNIALTLQPDFKWEQRWYQDQTLIHKLTAAPIIKKVPSLEQDHLQFPIPHNKLNTELSYIYRLVKVPVNSSVNSSSSVNYVQNNFSNTSNQMIGLEQVNAELDSTSKTSNVAIKNTSINGITVQANETVVLEIKFKTSKYRKYEDHMNSMITTNTFTEPYLEKRVQKLAINEGLSNFELLGRPVSLSNPKPLILASSVNFLNSNYSNSVAKPLYYQPHSQSITRTDKNVTGEAQSFYFPYKYCPIVKSGEKSYSVNWSVPKYIRKDYESMTNSALFDLNVRLIQSQLMQPRNSAEIALFQYSEESDLFKHLESTQVVSLLSEGYIAPFAGNYEMELSYNLPGLRYSNLGGNQGMIVKTIGQTKVPINITNSEYQNEQTKYIAEKNNNLQQAQNTRNTIINKLNDIKSHEHTKLNQAVNFVADVGRSIVNAVFGSPEKRQERRCKRNKNKC